MRARMLLEALGGARRAAAMRSRRLTLWKLGCSVLTAAERKDQNTQEAEAAHLRPRSIRGRRSPNITPRMAMKPQNANHSPFVAKEPLQANGEAQKHQKRNQEAVAQVAHTRGALDKDAVQLKSCHRDDRQRNRPGQIAHRQHAHRFYIGEQRNTSRRGPRPDTQATLPPPSGNAHTAEAFRTAR